MAFWFEDDNYNSGFKSYLVLLLVVIAGVGGLYILTTDVDLRLDSKSREKPEENINQPDTKAVDGKKLSKEKAVTRVVTEVGSAVVKITTAQKSSKFNIFAWEQEEGVSGQGSGVIINNKGHIVTNNHVIADVDQIKVKVPGEKQVYEAEIVGKDPVTDLAVIKIDTQKELPTVTFGDSSSLQVGQLAVAIGNPYGFSNTVTTGVVSALNRRIPLKEEAELTNMIQTDAAINPGNSGGALLDIQGRVIGINTAIIEQGQGIGFAIPSNTVRKIVSQLIEKGEVIRPWIGIYGAEVTKKLAGEYDLAAAEGVYVFKVISGSPAAKSKLQRGDIIIKLNDRRVSDMIQLQDILHNFRVGKKVDVVVYRNNKKKKLQLKLGKMPKGD